MNDPASRREALSVPVAHWCRTGVIIPGTADEIAAWRERQRERAEADDAGQV